MCEVLTDATSRFLHAILHLEALEQCVTIHDAKYALSSFPTKIEDVYHKTWQRIISQSPQRVALARLLLLWVMYTKRRLTIEELRWAVATAPDTHRFEAERMVAEPFLMSLCCGLLRVDEKSKSVHLVRKSQAWL
jgi:ankyrin repeat domain-containing protein 50